MRTANAILAEKGSKVPAEAWVPEAAVLLRRGAAWPFQLVQLLIVLILAASLARELDSLFAWFGHRLEVLIVLAGIGCWRWAWFATQSIRALAYRYWAFRR